MTRHTSLAVKVHQFICISTNTPIPMQENGNVVFAYRVHAAVDARSIAGPCLNMLHNRIMCPVRLQDVVFTVAR